MSGKKVTFEKLIEFLSPDSKNYMGSGMTVEEYMLTGQAVQYEKSWQNQTREERKRRLYFLFEMVREKDRIVQKYGNFSSAFCDHVIEAVIEGSADDVDVWIDGMKPGDDIRDDRFAKFIELGQAWITTMPVLGRQKS